MGTPISEIVTDYAMVEIDDLRLKQDSADNPALFLRRMALYVKNGVPFFNSPPEMRERLTYSSPVWGEFYWTATAADTETIVDTGKVGFELMSASILTRGADGTVYTTPYREAHYDAESGMVTFPAAIAAGTEFQLDFYTDGVFQQDLTPEEKRILGLCIALVWYERFSGNWLNMQPKIADKSFSTASESGHIRAMTERLRERRSALNEEIRKYEENLAYRDVCVRTGNRGFYRY